MQSRGYSLLELIVTVGMISILLAIGTLKFPEYFRSHTAEAQTRLIYSELLQARVRALYERRETRLKFYPGRFEVYSSAAEGSLVAPVATHLLRHLIVVGGVGVNVDFDARGIAVNQRSICIDGPEQTGTVDSVKVSWSRISIGKKDKGDDCKAENITVR